MPAEVVIAGLGAFIGTLFGVIAYYEKRHRDSDARREAERDRREGILTAERDAWQHRWEASDARLGRISNAFIEAFNKPAPE